MHKLIWKEIRLVLGLTALAPLAFGQIQNSNAPKVLAITSWKPSSTNAARELVSISSGGTRNIARLSGHVLYGTDEKSMAFLQTPANGHRSASRLLVINPKTSAIIADKLVDHFQDGFQPVFWKVLTAGLLAVRSKESTVCIPIFNGHRFAVAEANWKTGKVLPPPVPTPPGAERWEITDLCSVPVGIVIERGPFLTVFDLARDTTVLTLDNAGPDRRPTGNYYVFPGYGLVQSVRTKTMLYHITERNFATMIPSPIGVSYPGSITNLIKFSRPSPQMIQGKPCLIWGETKAAAGVANGMSQIVVFDVEAGKELLRKSLGPGFLSGFLVDSAGQNIYLIHSQPGEIYCLNLESHELSRFAKLGMTRFESWVAVH